jgi:Flp pilus assembly secretin CpaC
MVLLTGTVANPSEVEEATRLTQAFVGEKTTVVTKLKTAMPVQVNLQVKIAEVSRGLLKQVGVNLLSRDTTSGFQFGISRGSRRSMHRTCSACPPARCRCRSTRAADNSCSAAPTSTS